MLGIIKGALLRVEEDYLRCTLVYLGLYIMNWQCIGFWSNSSSKHSKETKDHNTNKDGGGGSNGKG